MLERCFFSFEAKIALSTLKLILYDCFIIVSDDLSVEVLVMSRGGRRPGAGAPKGNLNAVSFDYFVRILHSAEFLYQEGEITWDEFIQVADVVLDSLWKSKSGYLTSVLAILRSRKSGGTPSLADGSQ
jgi:hypothetical protein